MLDIYIVKGTWDYHEHPKWLSCQDGLVHKTRVSVHKLYINENYGKIETLFFVSRSLEYL